MVSKLYSSNETWTALHSIYQLSEGAGGMFKFIRIYCDIMFTLPVVWIQLLIIYVSSMHKAAQSWTISHLQFINCGTNPEELHC